MKNVLVFICLVAAFALPCRAQSKLQVFAQQMAGMQAYLQSLKSIYKTTSNGLNTVNSLKNGNVSLHQNYFSSLDNVSPAVKGNPKIKGISDLMQQIETTFDKAFAWQQSNAMLSSDEITYMKMVYNHLLDDCNKDIDELALVATDGKTQMSDDARIKKIDQLYADMQQKYIFSGSFTAKAYTLAQQRSADKDSKEALRKLYDIN